MAESTSTEWARLLPAAAGLCLLLAATRARAASLPDDDHQAMPCRPTIACTADLVRPGSIEIEAGYLFRKLREPIRQHSVPLLAKLTLAEWAQLQIGGNGPTFANAPVPTRYLDDLTAGLKFHVLDQSGYRPSVSWSATASLPLAAAQGYLRTYDLLLLLYITKDFGWLHADLNLGLNLWQLEAATKQQPWVALALSVELKHHVTVMVENYYFVDAAPIAPRDGGVLVGLAYAPRPFIMLDVGGDAGYFQDERSFSVFAGMTVIAADLWETAAERKLHPPAR